MGPTGLTETNNGPKAALSHVQANVALAALFLGTFVLGTAELLVVGILDLIARDMVVPISTAGTLVTAYALGIALGGPVLTAACLRLDRRFLLLVSLAAYVGGTLLMVMVSNFGLLIVARAVLGSLHGLFIGVAFAVATGIVPPERMGRAISTVIGGIAVSTALGVPLGTFVGQALGWRGAFGAIVVFGVIALVGALVFIPLVENNRTGGLTAQIRYALAPRVLAVLGVGLLLLGGQFATLTYITPFLEEITGISSGLIGVFLLTYGVATAVGTFIGGRAADRSATVTLVVANMLLILALALLYLVASAPLWVAMAMSVWGLVGFGLIPSLQYRVVTLAGPGRDLAATLPASALNAGIAAGAVVGGWAVANYGTSASVVAGVAICAIALPATWATRYLNVPADYQQKAALDAREANG